MNIRNLLINPKKVLSSPLFWLNLFAIILLLLFAGYMYTLDIPPQEYAFSIKETLLTLGIIIVLPLLLFFYKKRGHKMNSNTIVNSILAITAFTLAFFVSIYLENPDNNSYFETQEQVNRRHELVCYSKSLASLVNEDKITEDEAKEKINNQIEDENDRDVARDILRGSVDTDMKSNEEDSMTVPVGYKEWECNDNGCGFADDQFVWTISNEDRIFGTMFATMSLGGIIYSTNFIYAKDEGRS